MSRLQSVVEHSLKTRKEFLFLGDDGYTVEAHDHDGVLSILVLDPKDEPVFDHWGDFRLLMNHLKAHGGHVHH